MAKVRVKTDKGSVTTSIDYYSEAEPRLVPIREAFLSGVLPEDRAKSQVARLVGAARVAADMKPFIDNGMSDTSLIVAFVAWQEEHPLVVRLYGDQGVIAAAVLARPAESSVEA